MTRTLKSAVTMALAIACAAASLFGQARDRKANPAMRTGLASLSDDALLSELAGRQMQGLLDHAFNVNKVPPEQREAMLAIPAIARLADPNANLRDHERLALIRQIAAGADRVVASIDDPTVLMEHSTTLIKFGVEPDVNLMEYWGETPKTQKRLAPVVGTVMKMLDKAIENSKAQRDKLAEQLNNGNNNKVAEAWTKADNLVNTAEFTRAMVKYNEAMAQPTNAAGMEQRKKLAQEAIEFLEGYDSPETGVQAAVRNRMAKLNMVMREYGPANDLFESVVSGKANDKAIEPAPAPFEQYEARYFSVVCELMQGEIPRATEGLADVIAWQKANVPDPKVQKQLEAAADMLRFRIAMKERDKAKDPAAKRAAQEKAFGVLAELNEKQPALRPIIAEQLIEAMGDAVDLKKAELLIVQAVFNRGVQAAEAIDDPGKADPALQKQVEEAIAAAKEVMSRKDAKIGAAMLASMAIQIPLLHEKLGHKLDAANAYMDFIEKKQGNERNTKAAFDKAGYLLFTLLKDGEDKKDPAVATAWERFLNIAVRNFADKRFAFDLANRLRAKSPPQYAEAVKFFRMVPQNDKRFADAKFREMVTLTDWIYAVGPDKQPLLKGPEKAEKIQEALKAADEVRRVEKDRRKIAVVPLTQAELAVYDDKPDWPRALKTLEGFEKQVAGVDNEPLLIKRAMELRVAAHVQLNELTKATPILTKLLETEPGGRASGLVLGILQRLKVEFDRAVAANDIEKSKTIVKSMADLSGYLVKWATDHKDPNVRKNLYTYRVFDADTQRQYSASLEGEERTARLQKAMQQFEALRTKESVAEYKAMVAERLKANPQDKTDPESPDPAVTFGMALTSFDLKDWKTAAKELKSLSFAGKLGTRTRNEVDAKTGDVKVVPNDQYWEAMYKYYESVRQWTTAEPQNENAQKELGAVKTLLRRDFVADPDGVGGDKWHGDFEKLGKELIPDLDVDSLRKATPAAAPDTQPAPETN